MAKWQQLATEHKFNVQQKHTKIASLSQATENVGLQQLNKTTNLSIDRTTGLEAHRDPVLWEIEQQVLYVAHSIVHCIPLATQAAVGHHTVKAKFVFSLQ